jgi:hypothetical protein
MTGSGVANPLPLFHVGREQKASANPVEVGFLL